MPEVNIIVAINDHGAIARLAEFPAQAKVALGRALTRTASWARTRVLNAVSANMAVKKSDLDGRHRFGGITATKANPDRLNAHVEITGARIPLIRFGGRPKNVPKRQRGVSFAIGVMGSKTITRNAFVAQMKSGHVGFFRRVEGGGHVKITAKSGKRAGKAIWSGKGLAELRGPSVPYVADGTPEFQGLLKIDAGQRLELQIDREVNFILTGTSKGEGDGGGDG